MKPSLCSQITQKCYLYRARRSVHKSSLPHSQRTVFFCKLPWHFERPRRSFCRRSKNLLKTSLPSRCMTVTYWTDRRHGKCILFHWVRGWVLVRTLSRIPCRLHRRPRAAEFLHTQHSLLYYSLISTAYTKTCGRPVASLGEGSNPPPWETPSRAWHPTDID